MVARRATGFRVPFPCSYTRRNRRRAAQELAVVRHVRDLVHFTTRLNQNAQRLRDAVPRAHSGAIVVTASRSCDRDGCYHRHHCCYDTAPTPHLVLLAVGHTSDSNIIQTQQSTAAAWKRGMLGSEDTHGARVSTGTGTTTDLCNFQPSASSFTRACHRHTDTCHCRKITTLDEAG